MVYYLELQSLNILLATRRKKYKVAKGKLPSVLIFSMLNFTICRDFNFVRIIFHSVIQVIFDNNKNNPICLEFAVHLYVMKFFSIVNNFRLQQNLGNCEIYDCHLCQVRAWCCVTRPIQPCSVEPANMAQPGSIAFKPSHSLPALCWL